LTLADIKQKAGNKEWNYGKRLYAQGRVRRLRSSRLRAEYLIDDGMEHTVVIIVSGIIMTDGEKHFNRYTVAALIEASRDGTLRAMLFRNRSISSDDLFDATTLPLPQADNLKLEITISVDNPLSIGLRAGEDKLYVVKNIAEFITNVKERKPLKFGRHFTYDPKIADFSQKHKDFLRQLYLYYVSRKEGQNPLTGNQLRFMPMPDVLASLIFERLEDIPFICSLSGETQKQIDSAPLPAMFNVSGGDRGISIIAHVPEDLHLLTEDGRYVFFEGKVHKLSEMELPLMRTLSKHLSGSRAIFIFTKDKVQRVMGELLPSLMQSCIVNLDKRFEKKIKRLPLHTKIYLDREKAHIIAKLIFRYGDIEIDPFLIHDGAPMFLLRDAAGEKAVMDTLANAGFKVRKGYAFLEDSDDIWYFLTEGITALSDKAELYLSNDFKKLSVKKPNFTARLRTERQGLSLEMLDDDEPIDELIPLLEAIRLRRDYFRFTDGSMLSLEGTQEWQELAEAYLEAGELRQDERHVRPYRAAYFNALIKEKNLPVTTDNETLSHVAVRTEESEPPIKDLYAFQKRGFEWLISLWRLQMGGILADEMGLGKTLQTLAAISYIKDNESKLPSIVIAPTSLIYNWQSEAQRFTPDLKLAVLSGSRKQREEILSFILENPPDLIITSYPIIRRDISKIKKTEFSYIVLDEAQYIKDPSSITARSVKQLSGRCNIALSGTPMENNVGELWSLFDFALPGYLPPYREFLRRFDEGKNAPDLRKRIRPFLMRRLKRDVMAELPAKTERSYFAGMEPQQAKLYKAVLLQKHESIKELYDSKNLRKNSGAVLAAITELRQICCHPRLVLPTFQGESGKLNLLLEILPHMLENGHKILLFSQFTSMLNIIKKHTDALGIESMYLDGQTPSKDRLAMADSFNNGDCPLFLISLRAGGTGLNLTGADTVINYDPWWNPTTEDQAIDRAHRVGQDKNVQVIRLITKNSIEEKVVALGEHKRKLFDKLVTPGEVMPSKLSDKDIMALFD